MGVSHFAISGGVDPAAARIDARAPLLRAPEALADPVCIGQEETGGIDEKNAVGLRLDRERGDDRRWIRLRRGPLARRISALRPNTPIVAKEKHALPLALEAHEGAAAGLASVQTERIGSESRREHALVKQVAIQSAWSNLEQHLVAVRIDANADELRETNPWGAN